MPLAEPSLCSTRMMEKDAGTMILLIDGAAPAGRRARVPIRSSERSRQERCTAFLPSCWPALAGRVELL
jgi:hypothetical protein